MKFRALVSGCWIEIRVHVDSRNCSVNPSARGCDNIQIASSDCEPEWIDQLILIVENALSAGQDLKN